MTPTFIREPFEVAEDAPIVRAVQQATTNHLGQPPDHMGQTFWTDAALLADAGIETVIIGPAGAGLHSAEEWVDVQSILDLTQILVDTAILFCNE